MHLLTDSKLNTGNFNVECKTRCENTVVHPVDLDVAETSAQNLFNECCIVENPEEEDQNSKLVDDIEKITSVNVKLLNEDNVSDILLRESLVDVNKNKI